MLKKFFSTLPAALLLSTSVNADVLWQYGYDGSNDRGRLNATEFTDASGAVYLDWLEVDTASKGSILIDGPGYMHYDMSFKEICASSGYRCQNHSRDFLATPELGIVYKNLTSNECTNVKLTYDRHGTEFNRVYFVNMATEQADEHTFGFGGQEGGQTRHQVDLQNIPANGGAYFMLEYGGNGADNGHFIDMIRLEADGC